MLYLLVRNVTDAEVRHLQVALTGAGYPVPETGYFGRVTEKAVRAFQQARGLLLDGRVGNETRAALGMPLWVPAVAPIEGDPVVPPSRPGQPIRKLIVHHTAGPRTQTVEEIRRFHKEVRHWSDIAYHLVLRQPDDEAPEEITPGRPQNGDGWLDPGEQGAHTLSQNADSLGIVVVGDFTSAPPSQRILSTLVAQLAAYCLAGGLDPEVAILGHREAPGQATECPGKAFPIESIRQTVAQVLDGLGEALHD